MDFLNFSAKVDTFEKVENGNIGSISDLLQHLLFTGFGSNPPVPIQ